MFTLLRAIILFLIDCPFIILSIKYLSRNNSGDLCIIFQWHRCSKYCYLKDKHNQSPSSSNMGLSILDVSVANDKGYIYCVRPLLNNKLNGED